MAGLAMTNKMLDLVARRFRTLGEPYRLRILQEGAGEKSVGELVAALDGNQPMYPSICTFFPMPA